MLKSFTNMHVHTYGGTILPTAAECVTTEAVAAAMQSEAKVAS